MKISLSVALLFWLEGINLRKIRQLKWLDIISDGVLVTSKCVVMVYDSIKMEFRIDHEKEENVYYLYSFGKGSIRRLEPDKFNTVDEAKNAAYEIYSNELIRLKRKIDSFWEY